MFELILGSITVEGELHLSNRIPEPQIEKNISRSSCNSILNPNNLVFGNQHIIDFFYFLKTFVWAFASEQIIEFYFEFFYLFVHNFIEEVVDGPPIEMIEVCVDLSRSFDDMIFKDFCDAAEVGFGLFHFIAGFEVGSSLFEHNLFHLFVKFRIILLSSPHELLETINKLFFCLDAFGL